jgi:hypothetical protein
MAFERAHHLAGGHIPESDVAVGAGGCQHLAVETPRDTVDSALMAL